MGTVGLISYPDSGPMGKLKDMLANLAASVWQAMPVKQVATLAALNALTMNPASLPIGTLAVLTADDSGLASGSQFVIRADGHWYLTGTTTALSITTFLASLSTYTNLRTMVGSMAWDMVSATMLTCTSITGAYQPVTVLPKVVSGTGTTGANIAVNGTFSRAITFPAGTFTAVPSNILVTAASTRATPMAVARTKDGFNLQLSNWSNAAMANITYYWTAWQ